jgi:Transposase DDE domain
VSTQVIIWSEQSREYCGYISKDLFDLLWLQGLQLVTKIKKNMENKLLPLLDKTAAAKEGVDRNCQ